MFREGQSKYVKSDKYVIIKGKEIVLKYKEWRTLLERLDPINIIHNQDGYCYIDKPCICDDYDGICHTCPFSKLGQSGCLKAIKSIEPNFMKKMVGVSAYRMKWKEEDCFVVKNMLMKIYVALREMKNYYETERYTPKRFYEKPPKRRYVFEHIILPHPREIEYYPRMYGYTRWLMGIGHLTATQTLQANNIRKKIREGEQYLAQLKTQLKILTGDDC